MVVFEGREVVIERVPSLQGARLHVNSKGQVSVEIGFYEKFEEKDLQNFVDRHRRYLKNRLADYSVARLPDFNDGGKVFLLGKEYTVVRNKYICDYEIVGDILKVPNIMAGSYFATLLKGLLLPYLKMLTEQYSRKYRLRCSTVSLCNLHSVWGRCFNINKSIQYNIALAFVPKECLTYIVAHELCHIIYPNHSKAFWAKVAEIYPNYKESKALLHAYGLKHLLEVTGLERCRLQ